VRSHALSSFWRCYDQLPEHVKRLAKKNFALFKTNPRHPSLGFQKKGGIYAVEVGRSYRAIARERNGEYYWSGLERTKLTTISDSRSYAAEHDRECR
jgi:hypothetical protein